MVKKMREMGQIWKQYTGFQKCIELVCLGIAIIGIVTSIRMNLVGRSLWFDEGALAFSFSQRSLANLTSEGLELIQSAPVGWLYFTKILTLIFGNTDFVLRVPAILAYIACLIMMYLISRDVFHMYLPMTSVAFFASLPLMLQYSNVFKPYIADGLWCLMVIWFYHKYDNGKWKALTLGIAWAILIWFSNPACFVEGGFIVVTALWALVAKNRKKFMEQFIICIPMGVSFITYYFYWLRQTADDSRMRWYWREWNFPLLLNSKEDIYQIKKLVETIFAPFYRMEWLVILILCMTLIYAVIKKNKIILSIYVGFCVTVLASSLEMFPVNKRLWLFIYPLIILLTFAGLDGLIQREPKKHRSVYMIGILMLGMCIINGGIRYYWHAENVYWPGYEVKAEIEYLKSIIQPEDKVYVFSSQGPIFDYYNKYDFDVLQDTGNEVMVGTDPLTDEYSCEADLDYITNSQVCYVVLGDTWNMESYTAKLFPSLHAKGQFQMIYNGFDTPLWYFCKDVKDSKAAVSYDVIEQNEESGNVSYTIKITNSGEAYLNPEYESLALKSMETGEAYDLDKNIAPGESTTIEVVIRSGTTVTFSLENEYGIICQNGELSLGAGATGK